MLDFTLARFLACVEILVRTSGTTLNPPLSVPLGISGCRCNSESPVPYTTNSRLCLNNGPGHEGVEKIVDRAPILDRVY